MEMRIGSILKSRAFLEYNSELNTLTLIDIGTQPTDAKWIFEPLGLPNTYRIRHSLLKDHYLHVQSGPLVCTPIQFGANSSYWVLEPQKSFNTFSFRNFWRTDFYIFSDGNSVKAGPADLTQPATQWNLEDINDISLLVPIHLDALWLKHEQAVLSAQADFSRLPYFNGDRDINPNQANISEEILTQPQQPPDLYLNQGLHLHWALPDSLHRGTQLENKIHFPLAPNRWLVTRKFSGKQTQWVVESNYLHMLTDPLASSAISYPHKDSSHPAPYRHLGRKVPLAEWTEADHDGNNPHYLDSLTAVGYGEPTFAAFYPNCHSVFGFYDELSRDKTIQEMKGTTYEIIGWHSNFSGDILQDTQFQTKLNQLWSTHQHSVSTAPFQHETLKSELGWIIQDAEQDFFPNATFYFARLTLTADSVQEPEEPNSTAKIAVGNSATEALSAHLGLEVGKAAGQFQLEEQLEALQLLPQLEGVQLDSGAKFLEARHAQGFKAVHGGLIATIKPTTDSTPTAKADAQSAPNQAQVTLPDELAFQLNHFNLLRQQYDKAVAKRQSLREQLFADWYKYMVAAYPPEDAQDDFPDGDEIAYFMQAHTLKELEAINKTIGSADPAPQEPGSLVTQLQTVGEELYQAVENLQLIMVDDLNWSRFIEILNGRKALQESRFQTIISQLADALTVLQPNLGRYPDSIETISETEKSAIVVGINVILSNEFTTWTTPEIMLLLPAEAQALLTKQASQTEFAQSDKIRLGRLILETALPQTLTRRPRYKIDEVPAPRYWQPAEPVVLIADSELKLTERHGEDGRLREDGLLACYLVQHKEFDVETTATEDAFWDRLLEVQTRIDALEASEELPEGSSSRIGFYSWGSQPWHPFMLEWTVELFPIAENGSHSAVDRQYSPNFIETHYNFPEEGVDLKLKKELTTLNRVANVYSGRSLMLDYAQPLLIERLEEYCAKHLAPLYYDANNTPLAERRNKPPLEAITDWAVKNRDKLSPFNQAVLDIQAHFANNPTSPLAQTLSGFNAALLQHKQTLQLPIEDALGFDDAKQLADKVQKSIADANIHAPQPLNDFNPLRTGGLRLLHLRLVDTFGRIQTVFNGDPTQQIISSAPFLQLDPHTVKLPPRLVQPTRLNFNWLSADLAPADSDMQINSHPATTPVCGWFVPNYFDNSLLVYNQSGQPLGAIQGKGEELVWVSAPGRQHRIIEVDIVNKHLYKLVSYFLTQSRKYLDDVLTGLESALETVLPESAAEHDSLALLVGRPLAVVRAALELELHGLPAINQDWNLFRRTLLTYVRDSDRFTAVNFPLRVGEHSRLNDGLLAFWIENKKFDTKNEPYIDNKLYLPKTPDTPRTSTITHTDIMRHQGQTVPHITQAIDTPKRFLTMLVDPRGAVHVSSGILPVQSLKIPPDQYSTALHNLELTFYSGPFITKQTGIELPLPTEPGYTWSLLTKENGAWADTHEINPVEQNATFAAPHMVREGWLKLKPDPVQDAD